MANKQLGAARPGRKPIGGSTTITKAGLLRKTVYFSPEEWQAVRRLAFDEERPYTEIVRDAVRRWVMTKARARDVRGGPGR